MELEKSYLMKNDALVKLAFIMALKLFHMFFIQLIIMNRKFGKDCNQEQSVTPFLMLHPFSWSNGLVVKALDFQSRGPVFKTTG